MKVKGRPKKEFSQDWMRLRFIRGGKRLCLFTQRLLFEVDIHGAGNGIGYHQERGRQVIRSGIRVNSTLEVSVTRQDAAADQLVLREEI